MSPALAGRFFTTSALGGPLDCYLLPLKVQVRGGKKRGDREKLRQGGPIPKFLMLEPSSNPWQRMVVSEGVKHAESGRSPISSEFERHRQIPAPALGAACWGGWKSAIPASLGQNPCSLALGFCCKPPACPARQPQWHGWLSPSIII